VVEFSPDFVLVSCGFDSFFEDPLGGCAMTPFGYSFLVQEIQKIQSKICVVLEGGYSINNLKSGSENVVHSLLNQYDKV